MSVSRRQKVVVTPSIDDGWATTANAANLTDGNNATEIQVNNESGVGHWVRLDFNVPVKLSSLSCRARGGGAGVGAMSWVTSSGQVVTSGTQGPSVDFTVNFNSSLITWVQGTITTGRSSFDGFGEITPNYASAPTVRGIMRRVGAVLSLRATVYGSNITRPRTTTTHSADSTWWQAVGGTGLANLTDNTISTEIQANNQSITGHWVQLDFSPPIHLTALRLRARAGGAGSGAATWTTDNSQSLNSGSLGAGSEAVLTFNGTAVNWLRCTWTGSRTNFDGWAEIWPGRSPFGPVATGTNYLGGYSR